VPSPPHLELASPAGDGGKVHEAVVRSIAQRVLGGQYLPEAALPREDELAEEFGVSRTSIREAIKVLSAKGLIETRQRIGVRVRPRNEWRLLDPAVLSWHPNISQDEELLTGLLEARRLIEPAAAEMAAARANSKDLVAIETAYLGMERSLPHDILACCEGRRQLPPGCAVCKPQHRAAGARRHNRCGLACSVPDYERANAFADADLACSS
jgi:DNA-binding FadR family transcriptional regulator